MKDFAGIEQVIESFRAGEFVIIVDDEDRENEGDLAIAAEKCTQEKIAFMAREGRGLICIAMEGKRLDELQIPMMVSDNTSHFGTAFTVSVEARDGTTTGISAGDRATTVKRLIDPSARPEDFVKPGHMFPLRSSEGGTLARSGQTEAVVDCARLAKLYPAGVICEIMNDNGTMARMPQLQAFSQKHGIRIVSVAELIRYRRAHEKFVQCVATARLPTEYGDFEILAYEEHLSNRVHLVLRKGAITPGTPTLTHPLQWRERLWRRRYRGG